MLRTGVADDLRASLAEDGYLFPDYGGYCFAGVPATALSVLGDAPDHDDGAGPLPADVFDGVDAELGGGADVDVVVVALVDGYGFEQYRRDRGDYRLLDRLAEAGTVTPLTSIYPSETAAAITTIHTGSLPARHGVLGWDQYVEGVDSVLQTLPFATPDDEPAGEVHDVGAEVLLDATSLYTDLPAGVDATAVVPDGLLDTDFSAVAQAGLDGEEYADLDGAAAALQRAVEGADGRTYVYAYFNHVDSAAHVAGTESDVYHDQLAGVLEVLESALVEGLDDDLAGRTLLLLTADHGEVDTPGVEGNADLRDDRFDPLWDALRRGEDGEVVPPVGGPRNVQLHVRDGERETVRTLLERELDALVLDRETVLDRELFGPGDPSDLFLERLGDLVVVPRDLSVWYDAGLEYVGMHGGLAPAEMLVPFGAVRVDRLQG
jgi:predicted AlkP superfamily pyrophosphatase or phosphodiesterase